MCPLSLLVALGYSAASLADPPEVEWLRAWRAELHDPVRIAIDGEGSAWISDTRGGRVVQRSSEGQLTARWEDMGAPLAVGVDGEDHVLVGDAATGAVTAYDETGEVVYELGEGVGEFALPSDISVASDGTIFVSDGDMGEVRAYDEDGGWLYTIDGGDNPLVFPVGVHAQGDALYVIDQHSREVRVFDAAGDEILAFGEHGDDTGEIYAPQGVWVDTEDRIYVTDARLARVVVFDAEGGFLDEIGGYGTAPGYHRNPSDLAMDEYSRLYVVSNNNARIEIYGVDSFSDLDQYVSARVTLGQTELDWADAGTELEAVIEVPGYRPDELREVQANGISVVDDGEIGDADNNGESDLLVAFELERVLQQLPAEGAGVIELTGTVDGLNIVEEVAVTVVAAVADTAVDTGGTDTGDTSADPSATGPAPAPACGCRGEKAALLLLPVFLLGRRRRR